MRRTGSSLNGFGIKGTGPLGVLVAGLIISDVLKTGTEWVFILAILLYVSAGAFSLVSRSTK